LVLYYLQLQILDRLSLFDKEQGKEKFEELITISKNDPKKEQNVREK